MAVMAPLALVHFGKTVVRVKGIKLTMVLSMHDVILSQVTPRPDLD